MLKVKKGREEAQYTLEELHWGETRLRIDIEGPRVFEEIGRDTVVDYLEKVYHEYEEFCHETGGVEFAIVPITEEEFNITSNKVFCNLLAAMRLRGPVSGEWAWRIVGGLQDF